MIVACVLKSGGVYSREWVRKLREAVERWVPERYAFVCLTDLVLRQADVFDAPLKHGWPGWWSKIELFRPNVFPRGERVLYLDLDTILIESLEPLCRLTKSIVVGEMVGLRDFYRPNEFASGLMAWKAGGLDEIYAEFAADPAAAMQLCERTGDSRSWGDGAWIGGRCPKPPRFWQDEAPGKVVSYKVDCDRRKGPPKKASVVCFHGKPKPDHAAPWVRRFW
jgi:hypothetical protein